MAAVSPDDVSPRGTTRPDPRRSAQPQFFVKMANPTSMVHTLEW